MKQIYFVAIGLVILGVIIFGIFYSSIPQKEIWTFESKPEGTVVCRGLDCPFLDSTEECGLGMWIKENGDYASQLDARKMNEGLVIRDFSNC